MLVIKYHGDVRSETKGRGSRRTACCWKGGHRGFDRIAVRSHLTP
jgi:hypothetical protein